MSDGESFFKHYVKKEWSSTIFVAAVVTIVNLQFNWLKAIDSYAFVGLGNLLSMDAAYTAKDASVVVVEIDPRTHEGVYRERSPLGRCPLLEHLQAVYTADPDVVAIDIDLSPAVWIAEERTEWLRKQETAGKSTDESAAVGEDWKRELDCETALYAAIKGAATRSPNPASTALMEPFPASDAPLNQEKEDWKGLLTADAQNRVRFGNADLSVNYGLTLHRPDHAQALARVATELTGQKWDATPYIDPRAYRAQLDVIWIGEETSLSQSVRTALEAVQTRRPGSKRIVYFGAAYGGGDVFLTPLGEVFGVEVHAAAHASGALAGNHVLEFLIDIAFASIFGLAIAFFWMKYFTYRLAPDPLVRQLAKGWVILLVAVVVALVLILSVLSLAALANWSLWLSPIPIAIGMLIDSFVSGSVDQATHTCLKTRKQLAAGPAYTETMIIPPRLPWLASLLRSGAQRLPDVLGGDLCEHLLYRKPFATILIAGWSALWIFAFVLAWWLVLAH